MTITSSTPGTSNAVSRRPIAVVAVVLVSAAVVSLGLDLLAGASAAASAMPVVAMLLASRMDMAGRWRAVGALVLTLVSIAGVTFSAYALPGADVLAGRGVCLLAVWIIALAHHPRRAGACDDARAEQRFRTFFEDCPISLREMDLTEIRGTLDDLRRRGVTDFGAYFDAHPDALHAIAIAPRILNLNRAAVELVQARSSRDALDRAPQTLTPAQLQRIKEQLICLAEGRPLQPYEGRIRTLSGETRDVLVYMSVLGDDTNPMASVVYSSVDITERKRIEAELRRSAERERLMLCELDHRVRNNLSALLALIELGRQCAAGNLDTFADAIRGRVESMVRVHTLLSRGRWQPLSFRDLIHELATPAQRKALSLRGPDFTIGSRQATPLGMVIHELLTNSTKYGALSCEGGEVFVSWSATRTGSRRGPRIALQWRERGGPRITRPPQPGFGTGLITGLTGSELNGSVALHYPRDGASHDFTINLDDCPGPADAAGDVDDTNRAGEPRPVATGRDAEPALAASA